MRGKRGGPGRWRASANAKTAWLAACAHSSSALLAVERCDARQGLCPLPGAVQQAGQVGTFSLNLESIAILIAGLRGSGSGSGWGSGWGRV